MLKRIFLFLSLFLCLSLPITHAEKWIPFTVSTLASVLYIDADQIDVDNDTATIRVKEVHTGGQYEITKHRFYKKSRTFDDLYIALYSPDGKMITESNLNYPKLKNQAIEPHQSSDAMYHLFWTSPEENCVYLEDSQNGDRKFYIDTNSIDKSKAVATVWIKVEGVDHTSYFEFQFFKNTHTIMLMHHHRYEQGKLSQASIVTPREDPLTPGSAIEKAFYIVWPQEK